MIRKSNFYVPLLASVGLLIVSLLPASAGGTGAPQLSAVLGEHDLPLDAVANYSCHDGSFPVITCFESSSERDEDILASPEVSAGEGLGPEPVPPSFYVTWYAAANYGGGSFTASNSYANLGSIGWNDSISSFKSLNNGRPKWWQSTDFTGTSWRWLAGAQVSFVGDGANDQFSSVANVP